MILQLSFLFDRPGQFDSFLKILDVLIEDTGGKKKKKYQPMEVLWIRDILQHSMLRIHSGLLS